MRFEHADSCLEETDVNDPERQKGGPAAALLIDSRQRDVASYQVTLAPTRRRRPCKMLLGARYAVGTPPGPSAETPGTDVGLNVVVRTVK